MEEVLFSSYHHSITTPLSLPSTTPSTSYLSIIDVVIFCVVLLFSLSVGVLHTCLVNRKHGKNLSNSRESFDQYDAAQRESQRGSDASVEGDNSIQNSSLNVDGIGRQRNTGKDNNGINKKRDKFDEASSSTKNQPAGLALIRMNSYGNNVGNVDIMFQLVCYASIIVTIGLPVYSYLHGSSLAISILPAMLAAHLTSIGIVAPLLKVYHHRDVNRYSLKQKGDGRNRQHAEDIGFVHYLRKRFGGVVYNQNQQGVKHVEMSDNSSAPDFSFSILLTLTCLLIIILWAFFTVRKLIF